MGVEVDEVDRGWWLYCFAFDGQVFKFGITVNVPRRFKAHGGALRRHPDRRFTSNGAQYFPSWSNSEVVELIECRGGAVFDMERGGLRFLYGGKVGPEWLDARSQPSIARFARNVCARLRKSSGGIVYCSADAQRIINAL